MRLIHSLLILSVFILSSCATGKTEFKVIKAEATPQIEPTETATAVPTPVAVQTESAAAANSANATSAYKVLVGESLWRICRRL